MRHYIVDEKQFFSLMLFHDTIISIFVNWDLDTINQMIDENKSMQFSRLKQMQR